jgi:hypothetical protein
MARPIKNVPLMLTKNRVETISLCHGMDRILMQKFGNGQSLQCSKE